MLKKSFLIVMLSLLSAGLVALLIWSWTSGRYFDFRVFWTYISDSSLFSNSFKGFDSLSQFREALSSLTNYNVLGFNMSGGNNVLKILKIILNFLPYLGSLLSFPVQCLLAVVFLFAQLLSYLVDILTILLLGFQNSWVPFGEGGFILPIINPSLLP